MTTQPTPLDATIAAARSTRNEREELEVALDRNRRSSRELAIRLIFDHELSLARVAAITGHMRPTLRVWVESEIAKRAEAGKNSPTVREHDRP